MVQSLHLNIVLAFGLFMVTILFNLVFKLVNLQNLIFSSILCKIVINILIPLFNLNTSLVCIGLYLLLSYGFLKSNNKGKYIFKLFFIIQF